MCWAPEESPGLGGVRDTLCEALPEPSHGGAPNVPSAEGSVPPAGDPGGHVLFCVWLLLFSIMFVKFIHSCIYSYSSVIPMDI